MQAVILAGGKGKRIKSITQDKIPKVMLPVKSKPFLEYVLSYLKSQKIENVILCVGFKKEVIKNYFGDGRNFGMNIIYSEEETPLGTGGALRKAEDLIEGEKFILLNGDTIFSVNIEEIIAFHEKKNSLVTIALKYMDDTFRYGRVEIDSEGKIVRFIEKGVPGIGVINGGLYVVEKEIMHKIEYSPCSWERDILPSLVGDKLYGVAFSEYFVDIGIPEDYEKAKKKLALP